MISKYFRKSLSILFALILLSNAFAPATATTVHAANTTLSALMQKFPNGKYWNHVGGPNNPDGYTSTPCTHHNSGTCGYYPDDCDCNSFLNAIQCMGFAFKLAYDYYGENPRNWTKVYNLDTLKPGDIIRYLNNGHSIFVTAVNGDTVTYADCNQNATCIIRWGAIGSKLTIAMTLSYVSVAPYAASDTAIIYPEKPILSVLPENKSTETVKFSWQAAANATNYNLVIYQNGTQIQSIYSIPTLTYSLMLPVGKYSASLSSVNTAAGNSITKSDETEFSVVMAQVPVSGVLLNKTALTLKKNKTAKLKATVKPTNATNQKVTWKSANKKIATVTSNGTVKGIKKGKTYITAISNESKKTTKCTVVVK